MGARPAAAFAIVVAGEAALLAGDLAAARAELTEAVDLHAAIGADTGTAHALRQWRPPTSATRAWCAT